MTTAKGPLEYLSKTKKHFVLAKVSCLQPLTLTAGRLVLRLLKEVSASVIIAIKITAYNSSDC